MITQDLLKEYLDYREGKLFWIKAKSNQKWRASCGTLGKSKYIGSFTSEKEAHQAYVNYVSTYQNEYMRMD